MKALAELSTVAGVALAIGFIPKFKKPPHISSEYYLDVCVRAMFFANLLVLPGFHLDTVYNGPQHEPSYSRV
jgi:hypothetical protein